MSHVASKVPGLRVNIGIEAVAITAMSMSRPGFLEVFGSSELTNSIDAKFARLPILQSHHLTVTSRASGNRMAMTTTSGRRKEEGPWH
jgi:hypothetical protein